MASTAMDDFDIAADASPLFALGLCLDSSPLYYLAIAKRLQELHELSSSDDELVHFHPPQQPTSVSPHQNKPPQDDEMSQDDYVENYRMSNRTVDDFLRLLTGSGALRRNAVVAYDGNAEIDGLKTLLATLRYLGSQESIESLSASYGFEDESTLTRLIHLTCKAVVALASQLIYWPRKLDVAQKQAESLFSSSFGLDNTLGVMAWSELTSSFDNKMVLQGVVDHRLRLIDACCVFPKNDRGLAKVFKSSGLYRNTLSDDGKRSELLSSDSHILAPQLKTSCKSSSQNWLLTKFPSRTNSQGEELLAEKSYNRHITHVAMVTVREAFRHLILRFPRLCVLDNSIDSDLTESIVLVACVLHNFCIDRSEQLPHRQASFIYTSPILMKDTSGDLLTTDDVDKTPLKHHDVESGLTEQQLTKREEIVKVITTQRFRPKKPRKSI